ncbi:MAG: hypothetical protein ACR2MB_16260 [Acidimicrobiales bacterium]
MRQLSQNAAGGGRAYSLCGSGDDLSMSGFQEFSDLTPVDVASVKSHRHPSAVAMMRRRREAMIPTERLDLEQVGEEVHRLSMAKLKSPLVATKSPHLSMSFQVVAVVVRAPLVRACFMR